MSQLTESSHEMCGNLFWSSEGKLTHRNASDIGIGIGNLELSTIVACPGAGGSSVKRFNHRNVIAVFEFFLKGACLAGLGDEFEPRSCSGATDEGHCLL